MSDEASVVAAYLIPIAERWLIYSPLQQLACVVNTRAAELLAGGDSSAKLAAKADSRLGSLAREIETTPRPLPSVKTGSLQPLFLGLIPTRACNGNCLYCGFGAGHASPEVMDLSLAAAAVEWMAETVREQGGSTLEVHFFGGEPLVAGDVVDCAVHRARLLATQRGLKTHFQISTNGVFDEERAFFVGDYLDAVVLSLDGPEPIHNRHRPLKDGAGSFQAAAQTARRLSRLPAKLCLRACISQWSVGQMEEIAHWLCREFAPSTINFEVVVPTPETEAVGLRSPDPYQFAIRCVQACRIVESYGVEAVYASAAIETPRWTLCPLGQDTAIVSPDGRISSCYLPEERWQAKGLDFNIGCLSSSGSARIHRPSVDSLRAFVKTKERCRNCFCRWSCGGGCHVDNTYPGCTAAYDDFCIQTRIVTACSLLAKMGQEARADALLADRASLETLALHASDRIEHWEACRA